MISSQERARGAYLGLALGDALGATVEFMTPWEIVAAYGKHAKLRGGGWLHLKPGQVTDDTQMSLALGGALLANGRIDPCEIAAAFSQWMRGKPVDIGNTVRRGIVHFRHSGQPWVPPSPHDAGNGACMRVLPIALATWRRSAEEIRQACVAQSHITHNNELSDAATECVVAMLHLGLEGAGKEELRHGPVAGLLAAYPQFRFDDKECVNPSGYVVDTLRAVLAAFFRHDDFCSILVDVVNRGGDADTTGAIAGMLAGCYYGEQALPAEWLRVLDKDIQTACRAQAPALLQLATAQGGALLARVRVRNCPGGDDARSTRPVVV